MTATLLEGNVLETLKGIPDQSVQCAVTSPPYYSLRDYGTAAWQGGDPRCNHNPQKPDGGNRSDRTVPLGRGGMYRDTCLICGAVREDEQIGLESTPELYVEKLVVVFREVWRVLKDDGTLWLNIGDSYAANRGYQVPDGKYKDVGNGKPSKVPYGLKPKDLIGIPWMLAFALRADSWYLRSEIIWSKPNPMPESVTDRPTKSHEQIFLLTKSASYYYDYEAILEPANYDGRKDTMMKGSQKYANGFGPTDENPNSLHVKGHERWSRKMPGIGPKHGQERNRGEEYKPMKGYFITGRTERKLEGTGTAGDGGGLQGHSGYYDRDGNPRFNQMEDGTPARNKRTVWTVTTKPYKEAHFATFPPDLIEPCILAGSRAGDTVLDPFSGAGTTGVVAIKHNRNYIGCELNPKYIRMTKKRFSQIQPLLPI